MTSPFSPSPLPDESSHEILGGWNLEDSADRRAADDSLWVEPAAKPRSLPRSPRQTPDSRDDPMNGADLGLRIEQDETSSDLDSLLQPVLHGPSSKASPAAFAPDRTNGRSCAASKPPAATPKPGELFHGFLILRELGRGAFAKVYLAEQVELGRRLIALKVGRIEGDEPQMLARLQHTHIMPIHSVYDDAADGVRLMCMPYLGGANLAQVLEAAANCDSTKTAGRSLVEALDEVSRRFNSMSGASRAVSSPLSASPRSRSRVAGASRTLSQDRSPSVPVSLNRSPVNSIDPRQLSLSRIRSLWGRIVSLRGGTSLEVKSLEERDFDQPARQFLRDANTEQASVWVIARLAEGLEHAHIRGILHRDLKPSNILIAGDGTPMLLDFNLSNDTTAEAPEGGEKAMLGGTLPYMSPEHLDAFNPKSTTSRHAVDERSDIYALGLILFEMIAGEPAFAEQPPGRPLQELIQLMSKERQERPPSLRKARPGVSWSIESVVRKCLDPDPDKRYARARDLAEDLSRHLDDLPLEHAPELSWRERSFKWMRRNPRLCSATSIAAASTFLILLFGILVGLLAYHTQHLAARLKLQVFRSDFAQCQFLLNLASGPADHLQRGIELGEKTLAQQKVTPEGRLRGDSWIHRLTSTEQTEVIEQTAELILQVARARTYLAGRVGSEEDRRKALEWAVEWLDRAEKLDPSPPVALYSERARYLSALGDSERAGKDRQKAASTPPVTSRDFSLLGTSLLARGDRAGAEAALAKAIDLNPRAFWAWFTLGHCHFDQGRYADASGDFSACVALEPKFAWPHMNRGLALARQGRLREARDEYENAVKLSPRFAEAWLDHALTDLELNDLVSAENAITQAIRLGLGDSGAQVVRAEIKARMGKGEEAETLFAELLAKNPDDPILLTARGFFRMSSSSDKAQSDFEHALRTDPRNARAHYGLALILRKTSPTAALGQVDAALSADPNLLDALQLRALLRARLGDLAALEDVERLILIPTTHRLYNGACALALLVEKANQTRQASRALNLLDRALDAGFPAATAAKDADLASLRALPDYQKIIIKARKPAQGAPTVSGGGQSNQR